MLALLASIASLPLAACDDGEAIGIRSGPVVPDDSGDDGLDSGEALLIENLGVTENPSNVLSFYVEWRTTLPVATDVSIDCSDTYHHRFVDDDPRTRHRVFAMGFVDGAECEAFVVATRGGERHVALAPFRVGPLPEILPEPRLLHLDERAVQPGWTLFNLSNAAEAVPLHAVIVDELGRYRWYHRRSTDSAGSDIDTRTVPEGVLIGGRSSIRAAIVDWQGQVQWEANFSMHHDIRPIGDDGHLLYVGSAYDCPEYKAASVNELDVETDRVVWSWSFCEHYLPETVVANWSHVNTVEIFPDERALLISSRNQNALLKVDRASGDIVWIMGFSGLPDEGFNGDFATAPEDRFYHQHEPEIQPNGNILLFDNGYPDVREYSRAIEIHYDEEQMTAEVVWEYRHDPDLFANIWGDADRLPNGNTLVTFGFQRSRTDRTTFVEVDAAGDVVWELRLPYYWGSYRAERIVDPPAGAILSSEAE